MTRRRPAPTIHDPQQAALPGFGLFDVPPAPPALPGSMSCAARVAGLVGYALDQARHERGLSRAAVAARMAELTGERISEHMLNAMTAESHEGHRFPLQWLPALVEATGCADVARSVLEICGLTVLEPADARDAKLGALRRQMEMLKAEERRLARGGRHG